ncbi:uncharacterized protein LOC135831700 isoform X2 [Planococcus citri]|uniref:uncharacterized protein LOC135831700 isoform X2 n=1 Tax=Planococcus citri TaxID=170843 RepID=UPI0031F861F2
MNQSDSYRRRKVWNCIGCGRRSYSGCGAFFLFPKDPEKKRIWLKKLNIDPSSTIPVETRLCKMHFNHTDFIVGYKKIMLRKNAVPSVTVRPVKTHRPFRDYQVSCYVCGMMYAGYHSFHRIPVDTNVRQKWLKNVGIEISDFNSIPTGCIYLCDSHFAKEEFIYHPHALRSRLRKGAMPRMTSANCFNSNGSGSLDSSKREDFDTPKRDAAFVSSCSLNTKCAVALNDGIKDEKSMKSKKKKSSNKFKVGAVSSAEITSRKRPVPDESRISSSKNEDVCIIVDLTSEGSNPPEYLPKKGRSKKKNKVRLEEDFEYQELKSKMSGANRPKQSLKNSEADTALSNGNASGKKDLDQSRISSSKNEDVWFIVDLTSEGSNPPEYPSEKRRSKKKNKVRLEEDFEHQEPKSKISAVNPSERSSQCSNSKAVASSLSAENISGNKRRLNVSITIDLTTEGETEDTNPPDPESEVKKKRKLIRRLKKQINQLEEEITEYKIETLLNDLLEKKLVIMKEEKNMIKTKRERNIK